MGREDQIRALAYYYWEQEGHQKGHDSEYWLKAEKIWEQQNRKIKVKNTRTKSKSTGEQKGKVTAFSKR